MMGETAEVPEDDRFTVDKDGWLKFNHLFIEQEDIFKKAFAPPYYVPVPGIALSACEAAIAHFGEQVLEMECHVMDDYEASGIRWNRDELVEGCENDNPDYAFLKDNVEAWRRILEKVRAAK